MAIYKSVDFGRSWTAFQFYSGDCWRVYRRSPRSVVTRANEQEALCTDVYSNGEFAAAGPGSRIAFSTLEGRPSAHDFDHSPVLQVVSAEMFYSRPSAPSLLVFRRTLKTHLFRQCYPDILYCIHSLLHCALASGAVYCNRSCLCVCLWRAGGVCYHDNSRLRASSIFTKLGL